MHQARQECWARHAEAAPRASPGAPNSFVATLRNAEAARLAITAWTDSMCKHIKERFALLIRSKGIYASEVSLLTKSDAFIGQSRDVVIRHVFRIPSSLPRILDCPLKSGMDLVIRNILIVPSHDRRRVTDEHLHHRYGYSVLQKNGYHRHADAVYIEPWVAVVQQKGIVVPERLIYYGLTMLQQQHPVRSYAIARYRIVKTIVRIPKKRK